MYGSPVSSPMEVCSGWTLRDLTGNRHAGFRATEDHPQRWAGDYRVGGDLTSTEHTWRFQIIQCCPGKPPSTSRRVCRVALGLHANNRAREHSWQSPDSAPVL
eukprot:gene9220-biopygen7641